MSAPDDTASARAVLDAALQRVRADREHGASWLARHVAQATLDALPPDEGTPTSPDLLPALRDALRALALARPSMTAIANACATLWAAGSTLSSQPARLDAIRAEARRLVRSDEANLSAITATLRPLISGTVYTLSHSGTVERALIQLSRDEPDQRREAIVSLSHPGDEGRATALALADAGWDVTLVADAAMSIFVPRATVVIVGADSVRSDGSLVNKVGTALLALAAHTAGIPVYAVCETLKITPPGVALTLEEMDAAELLPSPHPANLHARNPYFDHTLAQHISGIVTERGLLSREQVAAVAQQTGDALARLLGHS